MLIQASVLQQITTKNLIKFTLSEVQLQSNFEIILKALKSHDSSISNLLAKMTNLENNAKSNESKAENKKKEYDQQRENLLKEQMKKIQNEVKDIKEKFKEKFNSFQEFSKEISAKMMHNSINPESINEKNQESQQLKKAVQELQQKIRIMQGRVDEHDSYHMRIEQLQNELKDQSNKVNQLEQDIQRIDSSQKSIKNQNSENQNMSNENISKLLSELESKLNEKLNQHKKATQHDIQGLNERINDLIKGHVSKINDTMNEQVKISKKLSEDVWKLNEQLYSYQSVHTEHQKFDPRRITELEKRVQSLEENMNQTFREKSAGNSKNISTAYRTQAPEWTPSPTKRDPFDKQDVKDLSQIKQEIINEEKANFKKEIIDKLKQQKGDFAKALKKLDSIHLKKDEDKQKLGTLQQKILRIEYILDNKVDQEGMKKWMRYIENKIGYLYRIVNVEVPQQDACIARKNWICLSCDKKLDSYKGKVGNHLVSAQLKGKTIQHDVVGGGMLFRSKSRYQIPSLKK